MFGLSSCVGGAFLHWDEEDGKGGTRLGRGWITSSDFYVMELIGSHCQDLGFPPNALESFWNTVPLLTQALPALSIWQPNTVVRTCHLTPFGSHAPLTSPRGLPLPHWWPSCRFPTLLALLLPQRACPRHSLSRACSCPRYSAGSPLHLLQIFGQMSPSRGSWYWPPCSLKNCKTPPFPSCQHSLSLSPALFPKVFTIF